tara:strand:+ start:27988 stop:32355 length:4368 start_codon:yes stop_codon:yes gene_type:complete
MAEEFTYGVTPINAEVDAEERAKIQRYTNAINAVSTPYKASGVTTPALGFFGTMYETYMQETIIGDSLRYGMFIDDKSAQNYGESTGDLVPEDMQMYYDPENRFNPQKFFMGNYKDLTDAESWVRRGMFEDVHGPQQFMERVERLRKMHNARGDLHGGSILGMLVGGLASFIDVSTFVPGLNVVKKVGTAKKIGTYMLNGMIAQGVQESALQLRQDLRTTMEAGINLTAGGVFGGGVGVWKAARDPLSSLHVSNPNHWLNPQNPVYMGVSNFGNGLANSAVLKPIIKGGKNTFEVVAENPVARSAGAMAAESVALGARIVKPTALMAQGALRSGVKVIGRGGVKILQNRYIGGTSPLIRGLTSASSKMALITAKLYDTGGILLNHMQKGKAEASIEDKTKRLLDSHEQVALRAKDNIIQTRMDLAKLNGENFSPIGQRASETATRASQLGKDIIKGKNQSGRKPPIERGTGTNFDDAEFVAIAREMNFGNLTDDMIAGYKNRFGDEGWQIIERNARKLADDTRAYHDAQIELLEALGMATKGDQDYVMAQLWSSKAIRANRTEAIAFFHGVFAKKPSDEFLLESHLMTEDQFNKLGKEEVTIKGDQIIAGKNVKEVKYDIDKGFEKKQEILEDWSGNVDRSLEAEASLKLSLAEEKLYTARRAAVLAARDLRKNNTDIKNATVAEVEKIIKYRQGQREAIALEKEKIKLEKERTQTELKEAEAELIVRMNQYHEISARTSGIKKKRITEVKEAEALMKMIEGEGVLASKADIDETRRMVTKADNELARSGEDALGEAVEKAAKKPVSSRRLATLRERLNNYNKRLSKIDSTLARLDPKLEKVGVALAAAKNAKASITKNRKILADELKLKNKEAGQSKRGVKKAKKEYNKQANRAPLYTYIEELVAKLSDGKRDPFGGWDGELIAASGRTKKRQIVLTNEQRLEAYRLGILDDDLMSAMRRSAEDLAPRMALRDTFGHKAEKEIVEDLQAEVQADFDLLKSGKSKAQRDKIQKKADEAKSDIENGILNLLGQYGKPIDPEGFLSWFGKTARSFNYVRYGSGFIIPSLTDLSNVLFTSGWGTFAVKNFKQSNAALKGLRSPEISRIAIYSERLMSSSANMKMMGVEDLGSKVGIGDHGTWKHYGTSIVDRSLGGLTETTNVMSGMRWWNTRMKAIAMMEMQHNLVVKMQNYAKLFDTASAQKGGAAEQEIAELAALGIGRDEARSIQKMMKKHPPSLDKGVYELEMGRWLNEGLEGQRAYDAVFSALDHTATRAIMTPSKGDTPFFMSRGFGKALLQFQTYGFVSMTKYMLPAFQRMATYGDLHAFMTLNIQALLGYTVVAATDLKRKGEILDRTPTEWGYDIMDRSGFLMWLSTPMAQISKELNVFGGGVGSRYSSERNRFALVGGPTGGLLQDLMDLKDSSVRGDTDAMQDTLIKLMPFKLYYQLANVAMGNEN